RGFLRGSLAPSRARGASLLSLRLRPRTGRALPIWIAGGAFRNGRVRQSEAARWGHADYSVCRTRGRLCVDSVWLASLANGVFSRTLVRARGRFLQEARKEPPQTESRVRTS